MLAASQGTHQLGENRAILDCLGRGEEMLVIAGLEICQKKGDGLQAVRRRVLSIPQHLVDQRPDFRGGEGPERRQNLRHRLGSVLVVKPQGQRGCPRRNPARSISASSFGRTLRSASARAPFRACSMAAVRSQATLFAGRGPGRKPQ